MHPDTAIYDARDLRVVWNFDQEEGEIHIALAPIRDQTEKVVRLRGTDEEIDELVRTIGEAANRAIRKYREHEAEEAASFAAWRRDVASGETELGFREYLKMRSWENGD